MNKKIVILGGIAGLAPSALALGVLVMFGSHHHPSAAQVADTGSTIYVNSAPVAAPQPPTAREVAAKLNCVRFEDHGRSQVGGVVDSGACWIGSQKYAIDTFLNKDIRDAWLKIAEPLGVVPAWETDYSVTYKSVPSS